MLVIRYISLLVVVFLIAADRDSLVEARPRLVKRQTTSVACYYGNTLLGYCYGGGSCVIVASNLYQCACPNGAYALNCTSQSGISSGGTTCSPSCANGSDDSI